MTNGMVVFGVLSTVYIMWALPDQVSTSDLDIYRDLCPLSTFCTVGSLRKPLMMRSGNETSCCLACFCDVHCYVYNDCCPDVDQLKHRPAASNTLIKPACLTAVVTPKDSPIVNAGDVSVDHYLMYDSCPSDYLDEEDTVAKCAGTATHFPTSLDDVTLVSDVSSRVFKNKHCALCHGVQAHEVISWELKVKQCRDMLIDVHLKSSEVTSYMLENCLLESTFPSTLALDSRLLHCNDVISTCPDGETLNDTSIKEKEACEKGPYMPFSNSNNIFKNAFCHQCHSSPDDDAPVCYSDSTWISRSGDIDFSSLLNFDDDHTDRQNVKCGEAEIYDYHTNVCREFFCPPYLAVSYGTCQPLITQLTMNVELRMFFRTTESLYLNFPIKAYNDKLTTRYVNRFRGMLRGLQCYDVDYFLYIYYEEASQKLSYLELVMYFGTGPKCTIQMLGNFVHKHPATITETFIVNDRVVRMKGQFTFFRSQFNDDSSLGYDLVMYRTAVGVRSGRIFDQFFVCPHFIFRPSTYSAVFGRQALGSNGNQPTSFSALTETVRKTFVLSETKIAVCTDAYLLDQNAAIHDHSAIWAYIVLSVAGYLVLNVLN